MSTFNSTMAALSDLRTTVFNRAIKIAENMIEAGRAVDSNVYATEGESEAVNPVNPVDVVEIKTNEKGEDMPITICGAKYTREQIVGAIVYVFGMYAGLIIRVGNHRFLAYAIAKGLGLIDWDFEPIVVNEKEAQVLEIQTNLQNSLAKDFSRNEQRMLAVNLYARGIVERESELARFGFNKTQRMCGFNIAKLTQDHGIELDKVINLGQTTLSAACKSDNPVEYVENLADAVTVTKALSKKDRESCLNLAEGAVKTLVQASVDGNLSQYKASIKTLNEIVAEFC